ncbi:MFS transporter [Streptomyces sp. NPDC057623]|uniref:MFS transporter n=1 Tax=Streptomyces sp. NPDC057623 TaxID=3346187 RepID=UPI0036C075CF
MFLTVIAGLGAVSPLATDMYVPALPDMARSLDTRVSDMQTTLTAFLLGVITGQLVLDPMTDLVGRRPVLLSGTAAFAVFRKAVDSDRSEPRRPEFPPGTRRLRVSFVRPTLWCGSGSRRVTLARTADGGGLVVPLTRIPLEGEGCVLVEAESAYEGPLQEALEPVVLRGLGPVQMTTRLAPFVITPPAATSSARPGLL